MYFGITSNCCFVGDMAFLLSPSRRRCIRPFRETDTDSMEQRHRVRFYPTPRLRRRVSQTRNLISITKLGPCSCRVRSPAMKGGNVTARPLYWRVMREGRLGVTWNGGREGGRGPLARFHSISAKHVPSVLRQNQNVLLNATLCGLLIKSINSYSLHLETKEVHDGLVFDGEIAFDSQSRRRIC